MYQKFTLPFDRIPQLSNRDKAYQNGDPRLRPFYEHSVDIDSFTEAINKRIQSDVDRSALVKALEDQYANIDTSSLTTDNINALQDPNTFTIITAHQPSILTGPLYYIYKIASAISLARQLNATYQNYKFIPCFVTGGEDHDFEEIATLHLFNKDFTWSTDQKGATGRMNLEGLDAVLTEVKATFGTSTHAEDLSKLIDQAYNKASNYGEFMIDFTNSLFSKYGLVIINMDHKAYKQQLLPYILKDIENEDSIAEVQKDQAALQEAGFSEQAHAREVNIFWHDGDRHRVIKEDNHYKIASNSYHKEELIELIKTHPENISPNVILRPVFQEVALPNLAYIGGGGELAYWLERKSLFAKWNIPFPMLIRRDSVLIVDAKSKKNLDLADVSIENLFQREEQILGQFAKAQSDVAIDLSAYKSSASDLFSAIEELTQKIDPTLSKAVGAESAKTQKSIDIIEQKMLRAAKQKNEVALNRISKIKKRLFPLNDSLQERYDNFIPFYLKHGQAWIDALLDQLDPMDKGFKVLVEE